MAIQKLDFKFVNQVRRNEQVKELADKVNEVINEANPLIDHISYDSANNKIVIDKDLDVGENDISAENVNVSGLLNLQPTQSAKKIYYHPILIQSDLDSGDSGFSIGITILNNDPTPFTFSTFIKWAEDLADAINGNAIINASGYYKDSTNEITSISHFLCVQADKSWRLRGGKYNNLHPSNASFTKATFASLPVDTFNDGVNAIN